MCKAIRSCLWIFVFLIPTASTPYAAAPESYGEVELIRDEWGIPHVYSDTDQGAMFGLGYAAAEDRAFQMTFALRSIQGRTAELLGDVAMNRRSTAVEFDKKMRIMGFYRAAQKLVPNLDEATRGLLNAYCRGVNDYFQENQENLHYLFQELDVQHEVWSPADSIAVWWGFGKFFAGNGLRDTMMYQQIKNGERHGRGPPPQPDESASVIKRGDVPDDWVKRVNQFAQEHAMNASGSNEEGPKFSHAWVVGGEKSSTGSAVLVSDPQTPVRNPSLLYEFHVSGETFNARGVGVAGSPIILIGFNERVAWGATALGADQADQFLLHTDDEHPNQYRFNGEWLEMEVWDETIRVKDGEDVPITLKWTRFGPVVSQIAYGVNRENQRMDVALKRIPISETEQETIQGAIAMMRSSSVEAFGQALHGWRFPSANFLAGDQAGNIGYWAIGAMPIRSPHALDEGNVTHDGSASKFDWQGIVPYELLPHVINPDKGYLHSGNHRPIESFYPIPIGISTGSLGDTPRSWRLRERLQAQDSFTPQEVLDIHYDTVNAPKRELVRLGYHLRDVLNAELPEDALNTLKHLESWYENGAHMDLRQQGTELAQVIPTMFRRVRTELAAKYGGGNSGLSRFLKTSKRRLDNDPNAEIPEDEREFVVNTLSAAWQAAQRSYGRDPKQWNQQARRQLQQQTLGYFSTLDGFGSLDPELDVNIPALRCIDGSTLFSQKAQSYSQWVPLHDVDQAKTILPIGLSERPGHESRLSQYEAWETGALHPAPLSRQAVEAYQAESRVLSG